MLSALFMVLVTTKACWSLEEPSLADTTGFEFRLDDMQSCPDEPDAPVTVEGLTLKHLNRTMLMADGRFNVKEPVGNLKGIMDLTKCDSKQQVDSCQHFVTLNFEDVCSELPKKNESWTPFFEQIRNFQPDCPLQPGTYDIENAPIDLSFMSDNPIIFGYWKAHHTIMEGEKLVSCTIITFSVIKPRPKL